MGNDASARFTAFQKRATANEDEWERLPYVDIDRTTATALVRGFRRRNVVDCTLLRAGRRNSNYRITLAGVKRPYLLRIYAAKDRSWQLERALTESLRGEVALPRIYYATFDRKLFTHAFAVYQFIDGRSLYELLSQRRTPPDELFA